MIIKDIVIFHEIFNNIAILMIAIDGILTFYKNSTDK